MNLHMLTVLIILTIALFAAVSALRSHLAMRRAHFRNAIERAQLRRDNASVAAAAIGVLAFVTWLAGVWLS